MSDSVAASSAYSAVLREFEFYSERLETERQLAQSVKAAAARLDAASRACLLRLRAAHRPGGLADLDGLCAAARERLAPCRVALTELVELLPHPDLQHRHQHQWRKAAERLALSVSLLSFLERGRPATLAQLPHELDLRPAWDPDALGLGLANHLRGLLALSGELARLSVNAVIAGGPDAAGGAGLPGRALECVTGLRRGFRRMLAESPAASATSAAAAVAADAEGRLAADLAKIEDVVYDLAVRRRTRPLPAATV